MKRLFTVSMMVGLLLVFTVAGFAQETVVKKSSGLKISANVGYHIESSDMEVDGGLVFGANFNAAIAKGFDVTAGVSMMSCEDDTGYWTVTETHVLLGVYYYFGDKEVTPKVGGGIDWGFLTLEILNAEGTGDAIGFWAAGGVDFKVGDKMFAGVEARYILADVDLGTIGGIQLLGVIGFDL